MPTPPPPAPAENPFRPEEFDQRLTKVHRSMEEAGIDTMLITTPANVYYLTGYRTFGSATQFLFIRSGEQPHFILRELEAPLLELTSWFQSCLTYHDDEDPLDIVASQITDHLPAGTTVGLEMGWPSLPSTAIARLTLIDHTRFRDATGIIEQHRAVKSPREIELCRRAAQLTTQGMKAALGAIRVGATENDVAAAAADAMTRAGSEWFAVSPIVTSGPRSGIPHTTYAGRVLIEGDTVLIELGATHHRYYAPLMRTGFLGTPPPQVVEMHRACRGGLEAAIATIKPGITSEQAHAACQQAIEKAGFAALFRKRLGYSVGIGFKSWMEAHIVALRPGDRRVLEAGMLFHMPPALRQHGAFGVGVSETILVTEAGCQPLADLPRDLFTKDAS